MAVDFRITAIYAEDLEEWYRKVREITDSVSQHAVAKYGDDEHEELEFEYNRQSFRLRSLLTMRVLNSSRGMSGSPGFRPGWWMVKTHLAAVRMKSAGVIGGY